MRLARVLSLTAALTAIASSSAFAWGKEGHEIIALIAAREMTPKALARIQPLLDPAYSEVKELAYVSSWADIVRYRMPQTRNWHFVDIEIDSGGYDATRDCPHGDCIVAQIGAEEFALQDRSVARDNRQTAMNFLIHFVGDLHQPLHCSDHHDRGGNEVQISAMNGRSENLHAYWDRDVVEALGRDSEAVAASLDSRITPAQRHAWAKGTIIDWANETFRLGRDHVYRDPQSIDVDSKIAAVQLEKAGVRLAAVLSRLPQQ